MIETKLNMCFMNDGITVKCASNCCKTYNFCPNIHNSVEKKIIILEENETISSKIISDEGRNLMLE